MESTNSHRSSQSASTAALATSHLRSTRSSTLPTRSKRNSEPGPSRHRRMLDNRNAKFPAKKLSISNLSSRFSQLIHSSEESQTARLQDVEKENVSLRLHEPQHVDKGPEHGNPLGILDEISNSTRTRKTRRSGNIAIYQDTPQRPLLDRSPFSSPAGPIQISPEDYSPIGFDHIHDNLGNMRLRDISGNEYRGSPLVSSPAHNSFKSVKKRKSFQLRAGFDTQEYIEHIEKQLEEAKNEMFSPTTNRSLQDQLRTARHDNDRLRKEMTEMREMYEAEMKKAIERKAEMEVDLRRKVKDLEDELEQKSVVIKDLELQHDERRLDSNTIDTFKATIEKLEHEKVSLEDENLSVSKRNEVLSELLAMSPTKLQSFELRSPTREKRGTGRPISMILPKLPTSPRARQTSQPTSIVPSPAVSTCGSFFGTNKSRTGSPQLGHHGLGLSDVDGLNTIGLELDQIDRVRVGRPSCNRSISRRSTLQSEASLHDTASAASVSSSPVEQTHQRQLPKRKPRKFMAGSTQLKPLLLPALTSEGMPLSANSTTSSPRFEFSRNISQNSIDPTICFLSKPAESAYEADTDESTLSTFQAVSSQAGDHTKAAYKTFEEIIAEHKASLAANHIEESELSTGVESRSSSDYQAASEHEGHRKQVKSSSMDRSWTFAQVNKSEPVDYFGPSVSCVEQTPPTHYPFSVQRLAKFDLESLDRLGLPDPQFDDLPDMCVNADDTLIMDVPQPLFSVIKPVGRPRVLPEYDTLPIEIHNVQHKQSIGSFDSRNSDVVDFEPQVSPTPKLYHNSDVKTNAKKRRYSQSLMSREMYDTDRLKTPQRSILQTRESLAMTKSPIDILRSNKLGAQPLPSLTISTIFGTISKCTTSVRDFRRDPLALARRVIANAWLSNWARFGKLSWWVLGLFIRSGIGGPKLREWKWDTYDGEEIARRVCENDGENIHPESLDPRCGAAPSCHTGDSNIERTDITNSAATTTQKVGWRKSVVLWGKFSVAIMLAVGGAVVKGPGEMLKDIDDSEPPSIGEIQHRRADTEPDCHHHESCCHPISHHAKTRASQDLESGRHNEFPSPFVPHFTSKSPSHYNSKSFAAQQECGYRVPLVSSEEIPYRDEEDDTLKAVKSPRMHVADFFHQRGASDAQQPRGFIGASTDRLRLTHSVNNSVAGGILQWPPSPGLIHCENNGSLR